MALIDFGMKARRELEELRKEIDRQNSAIASLTRRSDSGIDEHLDAYRGILKRRKALQEIANSTAKAGSAMKLANIAREALGLPLKRKGDA